MEIEIHILNFQLLTHISEETRKLCENALFTFQAKNKEFQEKRLRNLLHSFKRIDIVNIDAQIKKTIIRQN